MDEITLLARALDIVASRCPRGLAAIVGDASPPSEAEIETAANWRSSAERTSGSGNREGPVPRLAFRIIDVTGPIERATWPAIQKAGADFRNDHRLDWDAYRLHILQVSAPVRWRADGSALKRLAKRLDLSVPTIIRRRREVPLAIARAVVLQSSVLVSD
ncbi:MAG: hypothetical protein IJ822_03790 [Pyramidobacter sp.]|nr:hypothetical protein [Pyramidobacter sp.]MBQ8129379.1 hypothetical protein [Clostridia bacterium]MBR1895883.1 hypothetical protein [Pyramidobacter sp.]